MLPGDTQAKALESASMFKDYRIDQFYDPNRRAGKAVAGSLGWPGRIAWDVYLFYETGIQWRPHAPRPSEWMHQLKSEWADPAHYFSGDDLADALFRAACKLLQKKTMRLWRSKKNLNLDIFHKYQ